MNDFIKKRKIEKLHLIDILRRHSAKYKYYSSPNSY